MELTKTNWNKKDYDNFIKYLFTKQDITYQKFHGNLVKDVDIIGIKTPILKNIAKEISKGNYISFLKCCQKKYYEENIIYGLVISNIKSLDELNDYLDSFLLRIDNWACCDIVCSSLKIVKKNKEYFYNFILDNINSNNIWIKRFCFVLLLDYFIYEENLNDIFKLCEKYNVNSYYVQMAVAWLISICYVKYPIETSNFLLNDKLDNFTHNKAIQKIIESTRVKNKEEIRKLKRDNK